MLTMTSNLFVNVYCGCNSFGPFFRTLPRLELCSYDLDGGHNDAVFPLKNKYKFKTKDTFQMKLARKTFSIVFQISILLEEVFNRKP